MSPKPLVRTSAPSLGEAERDALSRVLGTGYFGMGPEVKALESELEAYLGGGMTVLCTATGSAALHLGAAALGLGPGDEVLVPSLTFVASFQAVAATGARPVACDVSPASALIDLGDARRRMTARTRAIMPVHYAGYPGDLAALHAFAREHGLRVIEDAAHAFGSRSDGRAVGSFGDVVCFSFDPIKNITCGQGGALVTGDAGVLARARAMRNLGIESGANPDEPEVRGPGWRYFMSDLMAAIGRVQLARFDAELKPARLAAAARYRERLRAVPGVTLLESTGEVVPHIMPVLVDAPRRAALRTALREAGFETLVHYRPNHRLAAFPAQPCPAADDLYARLLSLPLHGEVRAADVDHVCDVIGRCLGAR